MNPKNTTSKFPRSEHGFTLVELLVVITIIVVLAGISYATIGNMRASAHRSECISRLHSWGIAMGGYAADNNGKITASNWAPIGWDPAKSSPYLPYWTSDSVDLGAKQDGGAHAVQLKMRHCPAMPAPAPGSNPSVNYAMIRPNPVVSNTKEYSLASIQVPHHFMLMVDAKDAGNTGAMLSNVGDFTTWVQPLTLGGSTLRHKHVVNALLGDFSVKSMTWLEIQKGLKLGKWVNLEVPSNGGR